MNGLGIRWEVGGGGGVRGVGGVRGLTVEYSVLLFSEILKSFRRRDELPTEGGEGSWDQSSVAAAEEEGKCDRRRLKTLQRGLLN